MERGYSCALVTQGDLGAGQTLHSHGFLNTGFGMAGEELATAAAKMVRPYLLERGVAVRDNWAVLPAAGFPALTSLPAAALPAGFSPAFAEAARKLPDHSFDKGQLVEALMRGRTDRIIRGTVTGFRGREPGQAVVVRPQGGSEAAQLVSMPRTRAGRAVITRAEVPAAGGAA